MGPASSAIASATSRRDLLKLLSAFAAAGVLPVSAARAAPLPTRARIVIAGGGAAGLTAASRLARQLDGAQILLVEPSDLHVYQPGLTLVGAGLWRAERLIEATQRFVASGVRWKRAAVAAFEPDGNRVVLSDGTREPYDFLIVATGCALDYRAIAGMEPERIGRDGVGSIYAGPQAARATYEAMAAFVEAGGVGLFGRPATDLKCAGAPLKMAFIAEDLLTKAGNRNKARLVYNAHDANVFSVPLVAQKVEALFGARGIAVNRSHVLTAIDAGRRQATFRTPAGETTLDYDFIHVVPPMGAPAAVAGSTLAWQDGAFKGWLEVDRATLRHRRYPNVFGIGDVNGVPKGKTAASVKWQAPVAVDNLVAVLAGKEPSQSYNGYTSCPLITGIGKAMLVEFDYENRLVPSFPFIDPLAEHWLSWVIEEEMLRPTYMAMLRGRA
ncbi:MAG: NAD(P)/FAD-dependent oxidoreductase [Alphaproteobacteria bacterium]